MEYKLDHIAIACKDLKVTVDFYETLFGGKATEFRMGSGGFGFCYIKVNGVDTIQLLEANPEAGVDHYGLVADDLETAAEDFKGKGAKILRELRDRRGKLTAIFLEDPNGVEIEVRNPR